MMTNVSMTHFIVPKPLNNIQNPGNWSSYRGPCRSTGNEGGGGTTAIGGPGPSVFRVCRGPPQLEARNLMKQWEYLRVGMRLSESWRQDPGVPGTWTSDQDLNATGFADMHMQAQISYLFAQGTLFSFIWYMSRKYTFRYNGRRDLNSARHQCSRLRKKLALRYLIKVQGPSGWCIIELARNQEHFIFPVAVNKWLWHHREKLSSIQWNIRSDMFPGNPKPQL